MPSEEKQPFREFLLTQMNRRNMSGREFSKFLGISNSSLNRFLDERNPAMPSVEALGQISSALEIPVDVLFAKIGIEVAGIHTDPEAMAIADRIVQLSPNKRQIVDDLIFSLLKLSDKNE